MMPHGFSQTVGVHPGEHLRHGPDNVVDASDHRRLLPAGLFDFIQSGGHPALHGSQGPTSPPVTTAPKPQWVRGRGVGHDMVRHPPGGRTSRHAG
jgi:hypothetical protein